MALRYPIQTVYSLNSSNTLTTANNFNLPAYDYSGLLVKYVLNTMAGGNSSSSTIDVYIQGTDDGGTTWYDAARFAQFNDLSSTGNAKANFLTIPINMGDGKHIGLVTASSIAGSTVTGLPLMGQLGRVYVKFGSIAATGLATYAITITATNQDAMTS